jgi:hypothetical protein
VRLKRVKLYSLDNDNNVRLNRAILHALSTKKVRYEDGSTNPYSSYLTFLVDLCSINA